jgi:hypothetical protein
MKWTPEEEQRIQRTVSEITALDHSRIANRIRELRLEVKGLKSSTKHHQRRGESGEPFRREAALLNEVIGRINAALLANEVTRLFNESRKNH